MLDLNLFGGGGVNEKKNNFFTIFCVLQVPYMVKQIITFGACHLRFFFSFEKNSRIIIVKNSAS